MIFSHFVTSIYFVNNPQNLRRFWGFSYKNLKLKPANSYTFTKYFHNIAYRKAIFSLNLFYGYWQTI
jgi:hypothetical protein